jgi:hypothetical protein
MPMPKAAMNEDRRLVFRQDQIWLTGKVFDMQTKAKATCVQGFTD